MSWYGNNGIQPSCLSNATELETAVFLLKLPGATVVASVQFLAVPAMMNDIKGAMGDAKAGLTDAATDAAKKVIEEELAEKAPESLKPLFPCCGGPVGTMDRCICMVQEDQREQATLPNLPSISLAHLSNAMKNNVFLGTDLISDNIGVYLLSV